MNTIDDLRATLAGHAELHDEDLAARAGAVAGRVRTVRRRRAAVGAGVAAAAVAVTVGVVSTLQQPDPENENLLVGVAVPATLTSTGYTFEFLDGEESAAGADELRIRVPEADEPRLVSWATQGDGQEVRVRSRWGETFASSRPDFVDFVLVPEGESGWVEVTGDSRVALATFGLSDTRPEGYTREGVTFRQHREGSELVGAVVGDRGETSVSLTVTLPEGRLFIADVCQASGSDDLGAGPWSQQAVEGDPASGSTCSSVDEDFLDAGASGWSPVGPGLPVDGGRLRAGDEVTLTHTLTAGPRSDEEVVDEDALLGLAVYAMPETEDVLGNQVERVVEYDGHTWALRSVETTTLPADGWSVPVPQSDERLLLGMAHRWGDQNGTVSVTVDGATRWIRRGLRSGHGVDGIVPPDAQEVGLRSSAGLEGRAALVFYELVE